MIFIKIIYWNYERESAIVSSRKDLKIERPGQIHVFDRKTVFFCRCPDGKRHEKSDCSSRNTLASSLYGSTSGKEAGPGARRAASQAGYQYDYWMDSPGGRAAERAHNARWHHSIAHQARRTLAGARAGFPSNAQRNRRGPAGAPSPGLHCIRTFIVDIHAG